MSIWIELVASSMSVGGDAPVHTIALGLFEEASKIHWFKDIWVSAYTLLQLSELAEVQWMYQGQVDGWGGVVEQGGLSAALV